jgi:carboxypeptidase T
VFQIALIMKLSTIFFFVFVAFNTYSSWAQDYSRLKVYANDLELNKLANLGVAVDHGIRKEGVFFISDFSKEERQIMDTYDFNYEVLIEDVQAYYIEELNKPASKEGAALKNTTCSGSANGGSIFTPAVPTHFNLGTMGGYLKYEEMLAELDEMVATYPNLITAKAPISTFLTAQNRPLYHVRISDNPNVDESGEPKVLYTAIHHAREPMSLMETIFFMWYVLENYGSNPEITYLVNHMQLYFVPCINPDGYVYNQTTNPNGGGMWRKNRRLNSGGSYGVDLNRNYSYGWGTTGTSFTQTNETYCGTAAFSEPETQAMRWLVQNNKFVTAFNAHTYAEDILFPIGTTTAEFAPHHDYFQEYTNIMVTYNGYVAMKSSALYPASGDSDDYMYKVDIGVGVKDTMFVHTPEVGTAFWQPSSEIIPTCQEMVYPNLILAHIAGVYIQTTDQDPSNIATITGNFSHQARRLGRENGPVTVSIVPLQNIVSVGGPVVHDLALQQNGLGAISYTLSPSIQFGDQIKYILQTDNGYWIKKDTITKIYGAYTLQVTENGTAATNWTGNWNTTTSTFVSAPRSFTDTPTGNYVNNANTTYTYVPTIDLSNAVAAKLNFWAKWDIEADYDYVQLQVSTDNGATWVGQCGLYTVAGNSANGSVQPNNQPVWEGVQSTWVQEEIQLSDYLGQVIKVRFQLKSDGGTRKDGFYFDDFSIYYNEAGPTVAPVAQFQAPSTLCSGTAVNFTDLSQNSPTSWAWDFGDGFTSIEQNPSNVFAPGTYTVTLTVTNAAGTSVISQQITVQSAPVVGLSIADSDLVLCIEDGAVAMAVSPQNATISGSGVSGITFDPTGLSAGPVTISATTTDPLTGCVGTAQLTVILESCAQLDETAAPDFNVFPNPTTGQLSFSNLSVDAQLTMYDAQGKLVGEWTYQNQPIQLQVCEGVYYLEAQWNGQKQHKKVLVLGAN